VTVHRHYVCGHADALSAVRQQPWSRNADDDAPLLHFCGGVLLQQHRLSCAAFWFL
jgi:hypothetical protein